jgi:Rrf2 family protein
MIMYLKAAEDRADAKTMAQHMNVTLRFALKILRRLSIAGIVKSKKGANGGYQLAKLPQEISFKDVIEAIEGPININRCLDENCDCDRVDEKNLCAIHRRFIKINNAISQELQKNTFEDIEYKIIKKEKI